MLIEKVAQTGTTNSNYELGTVLWENPDPTQDFAEQDIILSDNIGNYDNYEIIYILAKGYPSTNSVSVSVTNSAYLSFTTNFLARRITGIPSGTVLHINDAYLNEAYATEPVVNNGRCIPLKVIGYKNTIPTVVQKEWQVYDDQERVVGTWFGEPLYRKTFSISASGVSAQETIDVTSLHIDKILNTAGYIINTDTGVNIMLLSDQQAITYYPSNNELSVYFNNSTSRSFSGYMTIEYTKTTD